MRHPSRQRRPDLSFRMPLEEARGVIVQHKNFLCAHRTIMRTQYVRYNLRHLLRKNVVI